MPTSLFKTCSVCKIEKPVTDFNKNKINIDGLQYLCRQCTKIATHKSYIKHREKILKKIKPQRQARKIKILKYIISYLEEHGCIDCGIKNPVCLEFDHVRGTKSNDVSRLVSSLNSLDKIKAEIAKCEVRCSNCHRIKTAMSQGWYNIILIPCK